MIAKIRTYLPKTAIFLIIFMLSACSFPGTTAEPEMVEPSQESDSGECAFMWANKPLPELSDELNQALQEKLPEAEGYAQAYGENCVTAEGDVVRFHAMETDYYLTITVKSLEDKRTLGKLVEDVMKVLAQFPTDGTPGPQPGYISITFQAPNDSFLLRVMRTEVESTLESGIRGEELFNALQEK